jgi:hypothetical protein
MLTRSSSDDCWIWREATTPSWILGNVLSEYLAVSWRRYCRLNGTTSPTNLPTWPLRPPQSEMFAQPFPAVDLTFFGCINLNSNIALRLLADPVERNGRTLPLSGHTPRRSCQRSYSAWRLCFSSVPLQSASMIGSIIKFSVSLGAVAASLFVISWIGLALLGF